MSNSKKFSKKTKLSQRIVAFNALSLSCALAGVMLLISILSYRAFMREEYIYLLMALIFASICARMCAKNLKGTEQEISDPTEAAERVTEVTESHFWRKVVTYTAVLYGAIILFALSMTMFKPPTVTTGDSMYGIENVHEAPLPCDPSSSSTYNSYNTTQGVGVNDVSQ